jgi:transposase
LVPYWWNNTLKDSMRLASFNARVETVSTKPFAALLAAGMSVREIAEEIGIAKSVVHRMKQKIEREAKEAETGEGGGG